jgi:hypothetical protein
MNLSWQAPATLTKAQMLEGSLRCFTLGLLGLIPLLGLPAALLALLEFRGVVVLKEEPWNAAEPYLISGVLLGGIGLIITLLVACGVLVGLISLLTQ